MVRTRAMIDTKKQTKKLTLKNPDPIRIKESSLTQAVRIITRETNLIQTENRVVETSTAIQTTSKRMDHKFTTIIKQIILLNRVIMQCLMVLILTTVVA